MNEHFFKISKLVMLILFLTTVTVQAEERHLVIIIDTSGSMFSNDAERYTAQLSKIISDMTGEADSLTVLTLGGGSCGTNVDSRLAIRLDPSNRVEFKNTLDSRIIYSGANSFSVPINTAISLLEPFPEKQRMLLLIADSGGLSCNPQDTTKLKALHSKGVHIAAINIGSTAGAFAKNPAFDFTTAAPDAARLVEAVALVYQKFLGSQKVQTGVVQGAIEVEIAPFVKEAFLVVAGDGPVESVEPNGNNPKAEIINFDLYGGGETKGIDEVIRGYRIVRLQKPEAGKWRFEVPGISGSAGWMLLQDSTLAIRFLSNLHAVQGMPAQINVEIYDSETGQRVREPSTLKKLILSLAVGKDAKNVEFKLNLDGTFSANQTFNSSGEQPIVAKVQSETLDKSIRRQMVVIEGRWNQRVTTKKQRVRVGTKVNLSVELTPEGNPALLIPPKSIDVSAEGINISLYPDSQSTISNENAFIYTGRWVPEELGTYNLEYVPTDVINPPIKKKNIEVVGFIEFGKALPIKFAPLEAQSEGTALLDISNSKIRGDVDLTVNSDFKAKRSALEIDLGKGWTSLDEDATFVHFSAKDSLTWPMRIRVGQCPGEVTESDDFSITLNGKDNEGGAISLSIPLTVQIKEDSWITCWWPIVAATEAVLVLMVVIHGYVSPSRFQARLGVFISPEEDINEGFFHPIRAEKGSGSGFYRDAAINICMDYRLSAKKHNACARLRAEGKGLRIQAVAGNTVWRRTADGDWENIETEETRTRFGDLYKNNDGTIFFEVRNG